MGERGPPPQHLCLGGVRQRQAHPAACFQARAWGCRGKAAGVGCAVVAMQWEGLARSVDQPRQLGGARNCSQHPALSLQVGGWGVGWWQGEWAGVGVWSLRCSELGWWAAIGVCGVGMSGEQHGCFSALQVQGLQMADATEGHCTVQESTRLSMLDTALEAVSKLRTGKAQVNRQWVTCCPAVRTQP